MAKALTSEELYIRNAENGIRAIKMGTKTPEIAEVEKYLNYLKPVNKGMYDDLKERYERILKDYHNKKRK